MTGRSHMALGATAGIVATTLAQPSHNAAQVALTTTIAAGAALACDLDTPNGLLANSLGPLTRVGARALGRICGGHRHGTHSLLFCGLTCLAVTIALQSSAPLHAFGHTVHTGQAALAAVAYITTAMALSALAGIHGAHCVLLAAAAAALGVRIGTDTEAIAIAFSAGCWSHLVGDALTPDGIPPLWPASDRRVSLAVIGHTGDLRERAITTVVILCLAVLVSNTLSTSQGREPQMRATAPGHQTVGR